MANNKKALFSQLVRLMVHIIKLISQPIKRSTSWAVTIKHVRHQIKKIQADTPSLTNNHIEDIWEKAEKKALLEAQKEMQQNSIVENLLWKQVFDDEYKIGDDNE